MNSLRYFEILCGKSVKDLFHMAGNHFGFSLHKIEKDFSDYLHDGGLPRYVRFVLNDFEKTLTIEDVSYCRIFG